jgi:hypothetical protein
MNKDAESYVFYRVYPADSMQLIAPSGRKIYIRWAEDKSHIVIEVPVELEK